MVATDRAKRAVSTAPAEAKSIEQLRLPALEVRQGHDRVLYSFAVDGKQLSSFASISRIGRDGGNKIFGYQRPEVRSHIAEIRTYLESHNPMIPNPVVLAFDGTVRFEAAGVSVSVDYARPGTLVIPVGPGRPATGKAAWVVDGQQRLAAIREARIPRFPMCVVGFIASSDQEQREQFILVNNTKPLPKGLIYELLPSTETLLPTMLQRRRFPTFLLDRLNLDEDSPLRGMISTPTVATGVIKDNSLIKMLENSLTDGALYRFRGEGEAGDVEGMLRVVKHFWEAVRDVFRPAWHLPPRKSRLMHGAGVVALGFVMDAIAERHRDSSIVKVECFRADLEPLRAVCRWTDGYWDFGPGVKRRWNEIQNTPKDIQLLTNYLLIQFKELVWNRVNS